MDLNGRISELPFASVSKRVLRAKPYTVKMCSPVGSFSWKSNTETQGTSEIKSHF